MKDISEYSDEQIETLINNYRRLGQIDDPRFSALLEEYDRRKGGGLKIDRTISLLEERARQGRFVSYKEVAAASDVEWTKVRYAMPRHLDNVLELCVRKNLPMLTAIVVNQQNLKTGILETDSLKGFLAGVRRAGVRVTNEDAFLAEEQRRVFDWATAQRSAT